MADNPVNWEAPGTLNSALTTELNSLADSGVSALSSEIDNSSSLDLFMQLEIALASLTPGSTPTLNVYMKQSADGTNFADGGVHSGHVWSTQVATGTGAKRMVRDGIVVPPGKFKLQVENRAGVTLAATGNTLKYRLYSEKVVTA